MHKFLELEESMIEIRHEVVKGKEMFKQQKNLTRKWQGG